MPNLTVQEIFDTLMVLHHARSSVYSQEEQILRCYCCYAAEEQESGLTKSKEVSQDVWRREFPIFHESVLKVHRIRLDAVILLREGFLVAESVHDMSVAAVMKGVAPSVED